jgi:hypothetical protein
MKTSKNDFMIVCMWNWQQKILLWWRAINYAQAHLFLSLYHMGKDSLWIFFHIFLFTKMILFSLCVCLHAISMNSHTFYLMNNWWNFALIFKNKFFIKFLFHFVFFFFYSACCNLHVTLSG